MVRHAFATFLALIFSSASPVSATSASPSAQQQDPPRPIALLVTGLEPKAPLQVAATQNGLMLQIQVTLQSGWHLYGRDTGNGQPVQVEIRSGSAFAASGPLNTPMDEQGLITGTAALTLPLAPVATGTGLHATVRCTVCDALQCLPPMTLELSLPPPSVLLVAIDESERTARIAAFLVERGFVTKVTTYTKVTQGECDAHDVVLADSPTFHQCKGMRAHVEKFPLTTTPIIAVGFLGTQLLEAQKVAMACGYI